MISRNADMQSIFKKLSDSNKDIVILIAKNIKASQEVTGLTHNPLSSNINSSNLSTNKLYKKI